MARCSSQKDSEQTPLTVTSYPCILSFHGGAVLPRKQEMATATDRLNWILGSLAAGKTIYVRTAMRCTKVTPKTAAKFAAIGRDLFKATEKSLYMSSGNRYVCLDFTQIDAV